MAPTSSPPREDPSSEVPSIRQRQLAPTVGPEASGGRNREGSAMGSYDDSIAVGRVLYAGNFPIVPPDEFWIPARSNPVKLSIVPIGGIHIFIGETVDSDGNPLVSNADATAAEQDAVAKFRSESQELPKEDSALDLKNFKPTQSAPEQEITVEDQCRSAWVSQVLEKQRCHFVHFIAHTAGAAPQEDGAGPVQVEAPENAAPDQQEAVGESGAPVEESILGNLSPISGDTQSMDTEEFDRRVKEYGYGAQPEVDSAQPKQVLATVAALGENGSEAADTQSDPQPSRRGSPMSRERPRRDSSSEELLSTEDMIAQAGMDAAYRSDILNKPITPEDVEALEAKRLELLATAKKFKDTAAAMLEERQHAAVFVEGFIQREQEVDEGLAKVKELRKHWEDKIVEAHHEVERVRRDLVTPRRITFATPTEQQPLATPKDNMTKAAEILKKKNEEIDIDYVRKLVASAVVQQSKADTSRRLESNPELCVSTAQKDAHDNRHRDNESRTGSSERRRQAREHPNPIPVPSKTPPSDPRRGKDAMYSGRDKYRHPTPPPNGHPRPPRRRSPAGNTRPQGHAGIVIRDNVLPSRNRNRERTPEPRRNQNNDHEPEPRRSRNEERDPEPRRSRNDQGSQRHGEGSHRSRSQHREGRGESEGGSKRSDRPPRRSPSPPPSGGGGGGGGGSGRRSRSRSKSPRHGSRDARERLNEYRTDYIGPKCFGRMIREEPKPRSSLKLPGNLKHYDGTERPDTWIEDYYNAVTFAGGTPNIACRMLQLYLVGPARIWLSDLEKNSIFCWFDLKTAFEKHFRGTYKRPATASDLQACIQKKGESSRNFLTRCVLRLCAPSPHFVRRCSPEFRRPANTPRLSDLVVRRASAASSSSLLHSRFFLTFTASPSAELVAAAGTFFYVKNNGPADLICLPPFDPAPPAKTNWSYNPKEAHNETNRIIRFMKQKMKDTGICSDDIVRTFISRRVLPLKRRAHRMSEMYGPGDPTKITGLPLSKKDVVLKARQICQTAMPFNWKWGLLPFSTTNPPTQEAKDRFPLIEAERRGVCRKRALDSFDPDPYIFWKDLKMGKTPASRLGRSPPKPTGSSDDLVMLEIHEHVPPLRAEAGTEFVDKLMAQGQKNKRSPSDDGSSQAPPSKRFRTEPLGEKKVGVRRAQADANRFRVKKDNFRAGVLRAGRFQPGWCAYRSPFSTDHPHAAAKCSWRPAFRGCFCRATAQDLQAYQGEGDGSQRLFCGQQPLVLHVSKAAQNTVTKATGLLGRITDFKRRGQDLGHLLPYAQKWNAADITPATRGLGKDRQPAPDPIGNRSSEEHFTRLRCAVKELDSAWYDATNNLMLTADARKTLFEELLWEHRELVEAHDKCQVLPEASIDALKEQLANAQREKEQLIKQHQEELSAQKTSYQELKSQLVQLGLDHAKVLEAAEADAAAKMNEALENASNATVVLQAELEELAKARKAAEEKVARLEEERKECNQLILQTDNLAHRLFPDSQTHAAKKVNARRTTQGQANLAVPWTPHDHLVALNARVSHMRAIDRNLSDIPDVASQLFRTLWPGEVVPDTFSLISDRLKGAGRRIREWQCSAARAGADSVLRVACSWYPELDLDALTGVREGAETDLDPILAAKRQDRAYRIAEYAEMRTFIPPPHGVQDYLDEEEDEAEEEPLDDAGAGDAPPEAPAA
ncbi:hypothetical protein QYE76_041550 [Lolium multiflorum]|uniref:Retrotransposon gag domain-containing protein n=1 Tax=Lolium multiflorum TaxID=4521 RepID=A0AAD8WTW9_LOLMU|nr:hypothetical protein QYE76_041550 [Lolium multiflorum]